MGGPTIVDGSRIGWQPHVLPGSVRRVLSVDPETGGYVHHRCVFPGSVPAAARRFHHSVRETFFFLGGDLPSWEFENAADLTGRFVEFRRGTFMDRPPLSIHGRHPDRGSITGSEFLIWSSHGGEFEADKTESELVPLVGATPDYRHHFRPPVVLDADGLPWEAHPKLAAVNVRYLSRQSPGGGGIDPVALVSFPPGWPSAPVSVALPKRGWIFVRWGRLTPADASRFVPPFEVGTFVEWREPAAIELAAGSIGGEGCQLLWVGPLA
jgi:hypothetical protein